MPPGVFVWECNALPAVLLVPAQAMGMAFQREAKGRMFLLQSVAWGILTPCKNIFGDGFSCLGSFLLSREGKKYSQRLGALL